ncbi:hypothetical protein NMG60_11011900 [Bertholletia excelsa]
MLNAVTRVSPPLPNPSNPRSFAPGTCKTEDIDQTTTNKHKRKRLANDDSKFVLHVELSHAEELDSRNMGPGGERRRYQVFAWVIPGIEFVTPEVDGLPDPAWALVYSMQVLSPKVGKYLHIEVVRTCSKSDPGTSTGNVLIGWTQIPLPREVDKIKAGRYGLLRPVGPGFVSEGYIILFMKIETLEDHGDSS